MTLWIDADGFPKRQREIALSAARRKGIAAVVVSDRPLNKQDQQGASYVTVEPGRDSSDRFIESRIKEGDLILTRDVPAMQRCISKGGICMDHTGRLFDLDSIGERLSIRSFMEYYRETYGSPETIKREGKREIEGFANSLDRFLEA